MQKKSDNYIDGKWVRSSSSQTLAVISPGTEEVIGEVPDSSPQDAALAVEAAVRAGCDGGGWASWSRDDRAQLLDRLADRLVEMEDRFAPVMTSEMGQTLALSRGGVQLPAAWARFYAAELRKDSGEYYVEDTASRSLVFKEPVGVVAALTPFNGGIAGAMQKIIPALATGCTTVWKPAHQTPLSALVFADLLDTLDLPMGVINIVTGGRDAGAALVQHPGVNKVAFTGSTAVGQWIMQQSSHSMKRLTLELGGKSAAVILDDADAAFAADSLTKMALTLTGQVCHCQSRILVPRARYKEFSEAIASAAAQLAFGDPFDPASFAGPLISSDQRNRVEDYVAIGKGEGATLLTGGNRPAAPGRGWYFEPTIFGDATNDMRIAREEIFGPVLTLISYDNEDEAIAVANDSEYGLSGSVWSADAGRAARIARRLHTGQISINGERHPVGAPFGGLKLSGLGRQRCAETLEEYVELRAIAVGKSA